jgi:hypothetical protein
MTPVRAAEVTVQVCLKPRLATRFITPYKVQCIILFHFYFKPHYQKLQTNFNQEYIKIYGLVLIAVTPAITGWGDGGIRNHGTFPN